ncbi:MAG: FlgD immunoglobulin-like domain containing protein, partial [bacterium]|nr:FlgD immunoglobulin-like domain containing protein [bacterium]
RNLQSKIGLVAARGRAKVTDDYSNPFTAIEVNFGIIEYPSGANGQFLSTSSGITDSQGRAETTLTLGDKPGTYQVEVTRAGLAPATFTAVATGLPQDTTAPAQITNLVAGSPTTTSLALTWTAPGDDGDSGTAAAYDIRYSTSQITEGNWSLATQVTGEPAPQIAGTTQTLTIADLLSGTTYYFRMTASDEVPNTSSLSNEATGTTYLAVNPPAQVVVPASQPAGGCFWLEVKVGSAANPVENLFGISFVVKPEPSGLLTVEEIVVDTTETTGLLGQGLSAAQRAELISTEEILQGGDEARVGLSRRRQHGNLAGGYGRVARVLYHLSPGAAVGSNISFNLTGLSAYQVDGTSVAISLQGGSITVSQIEVWPGDTDNNGMVNELDILPVANYWLLTGPARTAGYPSTANGGWQGYAASAWNPAAATYADATGDGWVDEKEVVVIGMYWGLTHGPAPAAAPGRDIFAAGVDHTKNLAAYQAMYRMLECGMQNSECGSQKAEFGMRNAEGRIQETGLEGNETWQESEAIVRMKEFLGQLIELGLKGQVPAKSTLGQNYPNPVNPETWIPFSLAERAEVEIQIYSLSGQLIRTLDLGERGPGSYLTRKEAVHWDGKDNDGKEVASGIYLYQLRAGHYLSTRKMIILK